LKADRISFPSKVHSTLIFTACSSHVALSLTLQNDHFLPVICDGRDLTFLNLQHGVCSIFVVVLLVVNGDDADDDVE
jgi:hypothetical protein